MPGVDWIPAVSQLKSTLQLVTGDLQGASQTQKNFFVECPVVSQATSTVQLLSGDAEGAVQTQKRCLGTLNNVANGIPVVGHVKGVIHHAVGDHDGGNQALNSATRSVVVLASGAAAGIASGGMGAIPAGICAGSAYDIADTLISDKPKGFVCAVNHAMHNPSTGAIFDAAALLAGDALTGFSGGQMGARVSHNIVHNHGRMSKFEALLDSNIEELTQALEEGKPVITSHALSLRELAVKIAEEEALEIVEKEAFHILEKRLENYLFDPKTSQIVLEPYGDVESFMVLTGISMIEHFYFGEPNTTSAKPHPKLETKEQKLLKYLDYQNPQISKVTLTQKYPNSKIIIDKAAQQLKVSFAKNPTNFYKNNLELVSGDLWLSVQMPKEFTKFTSTVRMNNLSEGLLFSFIKNWKCWEEQISNLDQKLEVFAHILGNDLDLSNFDNMIQKIKDLENDKLIEIKSILFQIQLEIYDFILNNLTTVDYLGESVSDNGELELCFKFLDWSWSNQVMVLRMSEQLYPVVNFGFEDKRPVRTVISVNVVPFDELESETLCLGKNCCISN